MSASAAHRARRFDIDAFGTKLHKLVGRVVTPSAAASAARATG
jgi:hypothetical protein